MADKHRFKFKELKTYSSTEWLFKQKLYRKVFLASQTDWIRAELSLYNILFDEEDWEDMKG